MFGGVISDNATTVADLTLAAGIFDQELRANWGGSGDNPQIMLLIEALSFEFEAGEETAALMSDILEEVYLHHLATGGRDSNINVGSFASSTLIQALADGSGGLSERVQRTRPPYVLPVPWLVNLNTDTFEVAPRNAVDMDADLPFTLTAYGFVWSVTQGAGRQPSAPSAGDAPAVRAVLRNPPLVTR
tara:strand:- start:379 stop:942 length:564 start_codon:yes stop_codon:yes gene_type:complete